MLEITHLKDRVSGNLSAGESTRLDLGKATGLNVIYLILAGMLFVRVIKTAREKWLLTKFVAQ